MIEYKILEEDEGAYWFTGEFVDHCRNFKKETPLTKYEIEYLESHQAEIRKDYARSVISEYLQSWLNDDRLYNQFWNEWHHVVDPICEDVGSSHLMRGDKELEQERRR